MEKRSQHRLNDKFNQLKTIGWSASLLVFTMLPVGQITAHETGSMAEEAHQHEMLEIPADQPAPTVNLTLHPDPVRGWNLEVQTTHFRFAPEEISTASGKATVGDVIPGHAHLYIDGNKITRLYGNWYYLGNLAPGTHEIRVSLSTNQHEELMHNGEPIVATLEVNVPAGTAANPHSH